MNSRNILFVVAAFVAALTFVVFSPALKYEFVNWDDNIYVYENPHLKPPTLENISPLLIRPYFRSWTPIAFLSHALDVKVWQLNPFGHHLSSLLLHSLNAGLVFWVGVFLIEAFKRKGAHKKDDSETFTSSVISGAVVAALLFSLHPLRAESVAWVSDRKDLLCAFFMLLMCLVYLSRREAKNSSRGGYVMLLFLYMLALGSKSIAMMLPVVLILLDVLIFERKVRQSLLEMIPFFLLAVGAGLIARFAAPELGKDFIVGDKTLLQLMAFPFTSALFYIEKFFFPAGLSPVYHTNTYLPSQGSILLIAAPVAILLVTALAVYSWRKGQSYWLAAWGMFLLFVAPTFFGLLSGIQPVADRYTYFASIGLCVLVGGGIEKVFRPMSREIFSARSRVVLAVCVAILSLLSYITMQQIKIWKDPMTLWSYVIPRAPFPLAFNNLGMIQVERGMFEEAILSFESALTLKPSYGEALGNLGITYNKMGQNDKAIESYLKAIEVQPDHLDSYINLGTEYLSRNLPELAITTYGRALVYDSTFAAAYYSRALAYMKQENYDNAISEFRNSVAFAPSSADSWYNLGVAYEARLRLTESITSYERAINLKRDYLDAYINLGNVYASREEYDKALEVFGKAIVVNPKSADVFYNLGIILYSVGEIQKASKSFETAIKCDSSYAKAYHNLGIIHGHPADTPRSVSYLQSAARLGFEDSQKMLREKGLNW